MSQAYSDPKRENDTYALPDVEVWQARIVEVSSKCGVFDVPEDSENARGFCPSCDRATCVKDVTPTERTGWYYWYCFPGCLPDSDPIGPFATEAEALEDAQQYADDGEDN